MTTHPNEAKSPIPWNQRRLVGQKAPLRLREIWAILIRLSLADKARDLALFNLSIDSKLRGYDLLSLRIFDIPPGDQHLAACHGYATKRASTGSIRDHHADSSVSRSLDREGASRFRPVFVSKSSSQVAASIHSSVRSYCDLLGKVYRFGCASLRYPYHASNKGHTHLPTRPEPASRPASSWVYEVGEHVAVPRH